MISCAQAGLIGSPQGFQKYSATTKAYIDLAQPGGGWDAQSSAYNQTPAVVSGDELVADTVSAPGSYVNTLSNDGIFSLDTGGDSSRQLIVADIYDFSLRAYYGGATFAINNQSPNADPLDDPIVLRYNQAMTAQNLSALFIDAELDSLTFAITSGSAPAGTSVNSAGQWTGTPSAVSSGSFTLTATDPYNATGILVVAWSVIDQVAVPDVDDPGTLEGAAFAAIAAAFLVASATYEYSEVPFGEVISQSPPATTLVDPGSTVTVAVSLGGYIAVDAGFGAGMLKVLKRKRNRSRKRRKFKKVRYQ